MRRWLSDEVQRLEQDVGGPLAKGVLELVDHQAVAVVAQTLQGDGRARHIAAQAFQLPAFAGLAGNGRIQREAVPRGREGGENGRTLYITESGTGSVLAAELPEPGVTMYGLS